MRAQPSFSAPGSVSPNGLGGFDSHLIDSRKMEASAATGRRNFDSFIDDLDELLLPDLPRQIVSTPVFNATPSHATPGLGSDSNRSEEVSRSKSLPDSEEDLGRLFKIRDEGAITCQGPPILDYDSDSNKAYPSITILGRRGLEDEGATACREAPVLVMHSQPDDYPESFSGSHPGLTITSTPQGCFLHWKGLKPSEVLEFDSGLMAQSTLRRIDPREPEIFNHSAQHRHTATTTSTT
jgi:hypothetical protein